MPGKPARIDIGLTVVGLLAVAAIFVPFAFNIIPGWQLLHLNLSPVMLLVAVPFLLSMPIAGASALWLVHGRLSRFARIALYRAAAISAGMTLGWIVCAFSFDRTASQRDWQFLFAFVGIPAVAFGVGLFLTIRHGRRFGATGVNCVVAAQLAFIANALLCLYLAWEVGWQPGAYLTVVACLAYAAQIARAFRVRPNQRERTASDSPPIRRA